MFKALTVQFTITEKSGTPQVHEGFYTRVKPEVIPAMRDHLEGILRRVLTEQHIEELFEVR